MIGMAVTLYAVALLCIAAIPFWKLRGNLTALQYGAHMMLFVALAGVVLGDIFPQFTTWAILAYAFSEELPRGVLLYLLVIAGTGGIAQRAILGATFGWLELFIKLYTEFSAGSATIDALPYLGVVGGESVLFHIVISVVIYRNLKSPGQLIWSIILATLLHTAANLFVQNEVFGVADNLAKYVLPSTCLLIVYALMLGIACFRKLRSGEVRRLLSAWRQ
ncbi:hypothetical protein CU102_02845 [Phyllobacterium brassicacearum]|uniref:PrsW family intramembrane metalloprotease n=1 Tax=Phyllobacterium brassicacearum TaxID=314235 RepID=A0A2P7BU99_9HYPH|nr:hypothetical protein [Phyllobacterium brassicacearum]PSH70059.1 hypothetical protein CU102_02845 [Phyllobacterium brassicacearum]TDQ34082.1 hypothetical protein DEV91_104285 [Phyllobacterium brassicacearum]